MKTMSLVKTFLVRKVSIFSKNLSSTRHARLRAGRFYAKGTPKENFPIKQESRYSNYGIPAYLILIYFVATLMYL